jgi:hypothetical protein
MRLRPITKIPVSLAVVALAMVATSCADGGSQLPPVPSTIVDVAADSTDTSPRATTTSDARAPDTSTTTTTVFVQRVAPATEEPPFEAVTITTEDDVDLFARLWRGGDIAVLYTHEYDASAAGSSGQRPPQSSEVLAPWTWTLAREGLTVLALDTRGHGRSGGTYNVKESQIDFAAAYEFLVAEGYEDIVAFATAGSAPVMADLSADGVIDLAGLAMLFTPLGETGFDAGTALADVDEPVWLVGIDAGSFGGVTKRLEPKVQNLYDRFIFPRVPSGLQFIDVYGDEYAGRQLEFIDFIAG